MNATSRKSSDMAPKKVLCSAKFVYENTKIIPRVHHPNSLMIWAAIRTGHPTIIMECGRSINSETYSMSVRNAFLQNGVQLPANGVNIFWDNAPPHKARRVSNCLTIFPSVEFTLILILFFLLMQSLLALGEDGIKREFFPPN